jgi:CRISPR-associated protein Csh1
MTVLECIQEIGRVVESENKDTIEKVLKNIPKAKKGKTRIIVKINFNVIDDLIEIIKNEPGDIEDLELAKEYVWVGNSKANSEQWSLTTNTLRYILGNSLFNLVGKIDKSSVLYKDLNDITSKFYLTDTTKSTGKNSPCLLNLAKVKDLNSISGIAGNESRISVADAEKKILKFLVSANEQIILWTVSYENKLLCQTNEYKHLVSSEKTGIHEEEYTLSGECSICGKKSIVSFENTKKMRFKYFITDKISFASDLVSDGFERNMVVCPNCLKSQLIAENFIDQHLKTRMGDYPVYLVPCLPNSEMDIQSLKELAGSALNTFDTLKNFDGIVDLEKSLSELTEEENQYLLTLIFETPSETAASSRFKIAKILYEIPESRFTVLKRQLLRSAREVNNSIGMHTSVSEFGHDLLKFDLKELYDYSIPLTNSSKTAVAKRNALETVASVIVSGKPNDSRTISKFLCYLRGMHNGANFKPSDLFRVTLQMNIFLAFMKESEAKDNEQPRSDKKLEEKDRKTTEDNRNREFLNKAVEFIKTVGYRDVHAGLFYVGVLCGNLENRQYRKLKSSPILNKISFRSMDKSDFVRFYNGLMESLKQYDIFALPNIQQMAFLAHLNLDRYLRLDNWGDAIRDEEVPFYILSGISFYFYSRFTGESKEEAEEEQNGE